MTDALTEPETGRLIAVAERSLARRAPRAITSDSSATMTGAKSSWPIGAGPDVERVGLPAGAVEQRLGAEVLATRSLLDFGVGVSCARLWCGVPSVLWAPCAPKRGKSRRPAVWAEQSVPLGE